MDEDSVSLVQMLPLIALGVVVFAGLWLADRIRPWELDTKVPDDWPPVSAKGRPIEVPFEGVSSVESRLLRLHEWLNRTRTTASWGIAVAILIFLGSLGTSLLFATICAIPLGLLVATRASLTRAMEEVVYSNDALWGSKHTDPPARPGSFIWLSSFRPESASYIGIVVSDDGQTGSARIVNRSIARRFVGVGGKSVVRGDVVAYRWVKGNLGAFPELVT
jgi:hypothetical protein